MTGNIEILSGPLSVLMIGNLEILSGTVVIS